MQHKLLYIVVLLGLCILTALSMGELLWGAAKNGIHWTEPFFYGICHQMPDRVIMVDGLKMAVNARCFGIFGGLLAGWFIIPVVIRYTHEKKWPLYLFYLAVMVQILDYTGNQFELWANTNLSRLLLGLFLGSSIAVAISDLFYKQTN